MNKRSIKILKKDKIIQADNIQPSTESARGESVNQLSLAQTINNWITERRENSRAEKAASEGVIATWERLSDTSH